MKIMALDSSGLVASVAVAEDETLLAEYTVNYKKTHSQTLLPMLDEVARMIDLDLQSVDAIAVAGGPGSFTGLRIGSATAKGLGLALDLPLISVPTVDALAWNLYGCQDLICPIMDARRNQVYTGIYTFDTGVFAIKHPQEPMAVDDLISILNQMGKEVVFLGDGVPVYREQIMWQITVPVRFAPAHLNRQRASAVAVLAMQYYQEGKTQSASEHRPEYLRLSQAERERAEKLKAVNP
ncbi:MAG: tRNA (adenosine(37)-N6)-threonylcarbamoyltransferase complex dimerization subunit type 1 TsaB [Lachnospiraceae bacterium]|nr:tRNA (adenosine(37)-N6)-threonylcarbamoyltransferase complex dimerization subunit type 1 TsaB [Lachnospiraceae bacterium]